MFTLKIKKLLSFVVLITACMSSKPQWRFYPSQNGLIKLIGRFDEECKFSFSGSAIQFSFEGSGAKLHIKHLSKDFPINYYQVIVDGKEKVLQVMNNQQEYYLADSLSVGVHNVKVVRRTEAFVGIDQFLGLSIQDGKLVQPQEVVDETIVFFGNSITCGYGNELSTMDPSQNNFTAQNENHYKAYASLASRALGVNHHSISYSGIGVYRNFDQDTVNTMHWCYDKTHPLEGHEQKWDFREKPFLIIINLGTNDFYGTVPPKDKFVSSYVKLLQKIKEKYEEVPFLLCVGPMLSDFYPPGQNSYTICKNYIQEIKEQLKGVADIKTLFFEPQQPPFGEDYHPTIATHQKMADTLTTFIQANYKW